jgi:hypothetical protein
MKTTYAAKTDRSAKECLAETSFIDPLLLQAMGAHKRLRHTKAPAGHTRMGNADGSAGPMGTGSAQVFMAASAARRR